MIDVQEGSSEIKRMEEREKERKSVCVNAQGRKIKGLFPAKDVKFAEQGDVRTSRKRKMRLKFQP